MNSIFGTGGVHNTVEKQKITVIVAGKPYTLVSADPPEYVRRIASFVDRKLSETMTATNLPSGQAAVLACFNLAEDLIRAQDENAVLRNRMERMALEGAIGKAGDQPPGGAADQAAEQPLAGGGQEPARGNQHSEE